MTFIENTICHNYATLNKQRVIFIVKTIYIDILICVNLFINYFILLACSKFSKIQPKQYRIILGALFGAACSLTILLPQINGIVNMAINLAIATVIIIITFGIKNRKVFIKNICTFFFVSFSFTGIMMAVWFLFTPQGMVVNNNVVYFNISPFLMIISTVVCYFIFRIISHISGRETPKMEICKVKIFACGNYAELYGKVDTGSTLSEPFCGAPVIAADQKTIEKVVPSAVLQYNCMSENYTNQLKDSTNIRLIPFGSIGGSGLLPAFEPDDIYINDTLYENRVFIAVCKPGILRGTCMALVNPLITEQSAANEK